MNNGGVANGTASDDDAYDEFLQYVNSKEEAAPTVKIVASTAVAIESDVETGGGAGTKTTTATTSTSDYSSYSRQSTRNANGSNHSRRYSVRRRSSTTTEERRNPFALREGNALIWRNVNMTLVSCLCKVYEYKYPNLISMNLTLMFFLTHLNMK